MTSTQIPSTGYPAAAEPTRAAPRMAAAKRGRNNRFILAGVLVLAVGGLVGGVVVSRAGSHTQVLAVARAVPMGATVTADDLVLANVSSDPNVTPLAASDESSVLGKVAQVDLAPGELLTAAMIGTSDGFVAGQALVALPLKAGQIPARGLAAGEHVEVLGTPGASGIGVSAAGAQNGAGTSSSGGVAGSTSSASTGAVTSRAATGIPAVVAEVGGFNQTAQTTTVDVRVAVADYATVADLASTGNIAVVLLPAGSP